MRLGTIASVIVSLALGASLGGCFSPNYGNGDLQCNTTDPICPSGYECIDGRCWKPGTGPSDAGIDGSIVDAGIDGSTTPVDASIDVVHSQTSLFATGAGGAHLVGTANSGSVLIGGQTGKSGNGTTRTVKWGLVPSAQVP
jgi:hypothetical protein